MSIFTDSSQTPFMTESQLQDEADNSEVHSDDSTNIKFYSKKQPFQVTIRIKTFLTFRARYRQCAVENVQGLILRSATNSEQPPVRQVHSLPRLRRGSYGGKKKKKHKTR